MQNCVFCGIVDGSLPAYKIWENSEYLAVLDIFPKIKGQVVLFSKQHLSSDIFSLEDEQINTFFLAGKQVVKLVKTVLNVGRVAQRIEGLEVEHAHIKFYPIYSVQEYNRQANLPGKREDDAELKKLFNSFTERKVIGNGDSSSQKAGTIR